MSLAAALSGLADGPQGAGRDRYRDVLVHQLSVRPAPPSRFRLVETAPPRSAAISAPRRVTYVRRGGSTHARRAGSTWRRREREERVKRRSPNLRPTLLLLLSRFSRVRLCVTPETAAHQAPPSLGFSGQEHWSELPFPSPTLPIANQGGCGTK